MVKRTKQPTKAQEDAARQRHEESISKKKQPKLYPESDLAEMTDEDRAEFHALNVQEAIQEAKASAAAPRPPAAKPLPTVNAAAEKVTKATIEVEEAKNKVTEKDVELSKEHNAAVESLTETYKEQANAFKLLGANIEAALGNTKVAGPKSSALSLRGITSKIMNVPSGGFVDRMLGNREEKQQYIKMREKMEPGKKEAGDAGKDFDKMKKEQKVLAGHVAERNEMKAGGYSSAHIAEHGEGINEKIKESMKALKDLTPGLAEKMDENKANILGEKSEARTPSATPKVSSSAAATEALDDQNTEIEKQTKLLEEIRDNTGGKQRVATVKTDATGNKFGDIIGAIGKGIGVAMKALGAGLTALGTGIGKGFAAAGKGIGAGIKGLLKGLGEGVAAFGKACESLVNPVVIAGLGIFVATIIGLAVALRIAAPAIKAFAPVMIELVDVIGNVFMKALDQIPAVIESIGDVITKIGDVIMGVISKISDSISDVINTITDSMVTLSKLDAGNLFKVGGAMVAVGGGMTAVAAGAVATAAGGAVATGIDKISTALFGPAAIPQTAAARVEEKTNAAIAAKQQTDEQPSQTVVATSNTKNQTNVIQPQKLARNQEGSQLAVQKNAYA